MKITFNKVARTILFVGVGLAIMAGALFLAVAQPGGSGVLASVRLADGSEYMVTQSCNWSVEPYTVGFYMRSGAADPWGWCYIDHEADRWSDVKMAYDRSTDAVVVTEQGVRRAMLDRKRNVFWIDNGDFSRDVAAPQAYQQPPYPMP